MDLPSTPEQRLLALGQRCAQGMSPLLEAPRRFDLTQGEATLELPSVPPGACLRAATSHTGLLDLALLDPQGVEMGSDQGTSFALLNPEGPLCLRKTGGIKLRLRGQGEAWLQLWSKKPGESG